jgi:hypothetical protein
MTKTDQEAGLARSWNRIQRDSSRETARLCAQIAESKPSKSRARSSPKNKTIMDPLPGYSSMHALLSSHETSIKMTCCWRRLCRTPAWCGCIVRSRAGRPHVRSNQDITCSLTANPLLTSKRKRDCRTPWMRCSPRLQING